MIDLVTYLALATTSFALGYYSGKKHGLEITAQHLTTSRKMVESLAKDVQEARAAQHDIRQQINGEKAGDQ